GDHVRQDLPARAHHGRARLVTRGLDAEDVRVRHNYFELFAVSFWLLALRSSLLHVPVYASADLLPMSNAGQHAAEIVGALRERGHQAYFAGGCVRDLLLSREPADYDVATDATPQQVMQIFPQTFAVGEQFGVVLVPSGGATGVLARQGTVVEVATFRSDVAYSDGRHPDEVRFTIDPREDVQ